AQGRPLFVAIAGENVDGHDHVAAAAAAGAAAALVSRPVEVALPQVVVGDTVEALASLASALQAQRTGQVVVAITGSNGKTSVKELCVSSLRRVGATTTSPGHRKTDIGLPLALNDGEGGAQCE